MNPNNANNPQIIVPDDFPKDMQIILNMVRPLVTEEEFADWVNWDEENTKEEEKEQLRADMYNFLQEHGAYLKAKALREQKEMQTQPNFNQSAQPAQPVQNTFNNSVDSLTNSSQSAFNPNLSPQANFNPNFQPPNQQNQVNQVNQMSNPINPPATDFNFNPSTNIPDFSQFTNSAGNLQPNFNSAVNSTINPANAIPNQVQAPNSNFNPGQFNFNPVNTGQAGGFVQEYQPQPQQLVQPQQQSQALNSQVAFQEIPQFVPPVLPVTSPTLEPIAPVNVESQVPEPILEFNQEFTRQIPPMQISENGDLITDKMPEAEFKVEEAMPTNIPTIPAVEPKVEPKIEILDQSFRSQTQPQARPERVERADNRDRNQDRNQVNQNTQTAQAQPQTRPERTERVERSDRPERTERNQPNQSNQNTQTAQAQPQTRPERTNKPDRSERTERNQPNQSNQNTQTAQAQPQTRPERTERVERTDNRDRNQDRGQDRNQGFGKKNNFNSSSISNISSNLDLDELYTTMNDLEKQKLQLQSAYYEKQQGLTQRIMELESKVVNLDIFSEKLKDVSSELNAHSAVVQDVKTSIGNIGSVSLQTQINNLRDEMRKTYREISYDLESVMREFSEFRLALSKGYQKMVEQLPETNINKENNN